MIGVLGSIPHAAPIPSALGSFRSPQVLGRNTESLSVIVRNAKPAFHPSLSEGPSRTLAQISASHVAKCETRRDGSCSRLKVGSLWLSACASSSRESPRSSSTTYMTRSTPIGCRRRGCSFMPRGRSTAVGGSSTSGSLARTSTPSLHGSGREAAAGMEPEGPRYQGVPCARDDRRLTPAPAILVAQACVGGSHRPGAALGTFRVQLGNTRASRRSALLTSTPGSALGSGPVAGHFSDPI